MITSETARSNKQLRTLWSLITVFAVILLPARLNADSATWKLDPTNNDWNTAANWTPETVPDLPTDVATFDVSNITDISIASEFGLDSIVFNPDASAYTFAISQPYVGSIGFSGAGVINNSGVTQNFDCFGNVGFGGSSTAGSAVVYTNKSLQGLGFTWITFIGFSNAGGATFINEGDSPDFGYGYMTFSDHASAGNSTILNESGQANGGITRFYGSATAGNSTITTQLGAILEFENLSTGGNATLIADGGTISFVQSSDGGLARVELTNAGILNLLHHAVGMLVTIGSLEGDDGTVQLGARQLSIGGNGLSTTYGGTITQTGSLIKTGNETLTLTGANTYTGGTTVTAGTLLAQAAIGSATGTGPVQVNAGTLGGTGNVTGAVTIGTGTGPRAFLAPGVRGPGTLSILNTLTFKSDGNYKYELGLTPRPRADQVNANGVTIETGATFLLRTKGNQTLALGTIFAVINNTAATPISGTFANLPDGSTFSVGNNTFQVSYEGGDGNDLTLTVVN